MGVGSGIVYDSDPEVEFRECELKAKFLTEGRSGFALIESMLWDRGFPLLSLHLERLQQSARYFGFALNPDRVRDELQALATQLESGKKYKVRAVFDRLGGIEVKSTAIGINELAARVAVADERVQSGDPLLFHKTTCRTQYERAQTRFLEHGLDDVLFLNERGEITEGTMHNVFVEIAGKLLTPPLQCGLLPGVYRSHVLRTDPRCRESVLTLNELERADAIYICNAVRGMRRAVLLC
jgi:para-aminobenzoate synthetase/4-amino-4-deoxychorismate lyase